MEKNILEVEDLGQVSYTHTHTHKHGHTVMHAHTCIATSVALIRAALMLW